jgi:phenylacetate-CoA ligase
VIDPNTGESGALGDKGELVITNLGRIGSPVIRYRTGDLVQLRSRPCPCGRPFILFEGGVLGRTDDMIVIRGVNVFPSAIANVMREFPEIEEFRVETYEQQAMRQLKLIIEPSSDQGGSVPLLQEKVSSLMRERIGLRPEVELVAPGTLPRFDLKAKRFFKV